MVYRCGDCQKDARQVNYVRTAALQLLLSVCVFVGTLYGLQTRAGPHPSWVLFVAATGVGVVLNLVLCTVVSRLTSRYVPYDGRPLPD
jgi:uncharacterized membrane protein YgdD (TMEM256/DUF423 family)